MKKNLLFIYCLLIASCCFADKIKYPDGFEPQVQSQSISFTENKGQISDQYHKPRPDVLFSGLANGMVFHLRNNGISYQLNRVVSWKADGSYPPSKGVPEGRGMVTEKEGQVPDQTTTYRLDINWLNCNTSAPIKKGNALPGYNNYYSEVCPNGVHHVKTYKEFTYQNIYKGIDLKWYEKNNNLKYDYIIAAGVDYKQIQFEIKGTEKISLNANGELIFETPFGDIIEQAPLVKQNGKTLISKWLIKNNVISFEIENLNPDADFIIDPAVRAWGTYCGGSNSELPRSCNTDVNGNIYITGNTSSNIGSAIATVGSHQSTYGGGSWDAFLVKFDPDGIRQWGTYYGGAGQDFGYSCNPWSESVVYMAGGTSSLTTSSVIATAGSHQSVNGGGTYDAFLVKFDSSGLRLWGTYYGDAGIDYGYSCDTDAGGSVYMAGSTDSNTGTAIATAGIHQSTYGGGSNDAFLVKFNSNGGRQWGSYYGGGLDDIGRTCATDANGNVYIAGVTSSTLGTEIATVGSHQPVFAGGFFGDGFLVKFNSLGVRQWGTYYGGTSIEDVLSSATDAVGNVYLTGRTQSNTGTEIATPGSHQPFIGGGEDGFLVKFNSGGTRLWGTYYGGPGSGYDNGYSCVTDGFGNVYMSGVTSPTSTGSIIATTGSHQTIYGGGSYEAYLVKFDPNGLRQWGTYYGGAGSDFGTFCATDAIGNVYLTGQTNSSTGTVIATAGSHQAAIGGAYDGFLVKFFVCPPPAPVNNASVGNQTICTNSSATLYATATGTISWFATPTSTTILNTGTVYITPPLTTGTYTYYAEAFTCAPSNARTAITVTVSICTGINNPVVILDGLNIYPNPNTGNFMVESKGGSIKNIEVYDLLGRIVHAELSEEYKVEINIKHLANGIYYVKVQSADELKVIKIIKQ